MDGIGGTRKYAKPLDPLLKWPGGKRALLKHILPFFPLTYNRYFEPFIGGGALFFYMQPERAVLADRNTELINCYLQIRDRPTEVIQHLHNMPNTERDYYRIREEVACDDVARAAQLVYLSTLAFNGIYRVNLKGKFNVPYGYKIHLNPCDEAKIYAASDTLSRAELRADDFEAAVSDASEGDLVYLDPPYTVAHSNNGFVKYNARIFSWEDQLRLARIAEYLSNRRCHVFVSNADHYTIRNLYPSFTCISITRSSIIAASPDFRREITECIFYRSSTER